MEINIKKELLDQSFWYSKESRKYHLTKPLRGMSKKEISWRLSWSNRIWSIASLSPDHKELLEEVLKLSDEDWDLINFDYNLRKLYGRNI